MRDEIDRDHALPRCHLVGPEQPNGPAAHIVSGAELKGVVDEIRINAFSMLKLVDVIGSCEHWGI